MSTDAPGGSQSSVVHVFEPNDRSLPPVWPYLLDLVDRRAFIKELAGAEVRGQRTNTAVGELWTLIDPIFQACIYVFLYTVIRGSSQTSSDFVTTIIGCVFFFNFTRISISDGGRAVVRNKGLVLNAIFPRAMLPVSEVYKGFVATLPALALYAIVFVVFGAPITGAILVIPLLLMIHTVLNLGVAFLLCTATALFADAANLLSYLLRVLMFCTPVIYPVSMLSPTLQGILSWNPFFALFAAYQSVMTGQVPSGALIFQSVAWALLFFVMGVWVFLRHERSFGIHL